MPASLSVDALLAHAQQKLLAGEYGPASNFIDMVLEQQPHYCAAWLLKAKAALAANDVRSATHAAQQAARNAADAPASWLLEIGNVFRQTGQLSDAIAMFQQAVAQSPDFVEGWNNLGVVAQSTDQRSLAKSAYQRALQLNDQLALVHNNYAALLMLDGDLAGAAQHFERAIAVDPQYAIAWKNYGGLLQEQHRYADALLAFERALAISPHYLEALAGAAFLQLHCVVWEGLDERIAILTHALTEAPTVPIAPFAVMAMIDDPAQQRRAAERWAAQYPIQRSKPTHAPTLKRIRLGYVGADFFNHATSWLTAGLFGQHNRRHFEVVGYDYGKADNSAIRQSLIASFDQFHTVPHLSKQAIADQIRSDEIDILIDLKGWTQHGRCDLLAWQPAPIQVHYLGFPGTLGAPWLDYLIADPMLIPTALRQHYTEAIAYLPDCYQINDNQRPIGPLPTRAEAGLPATGFVFCCMNQHYKILPGIFDLWMRLLIAVPDSVLWLIEIQQGQRQRLLFEASRRGVSIDRLVFASALPQSEHLGRLQLADLALDTPLCNSHTTASDMLWAGVPLLTCIGDCFASRVAASCLAAVGLNELITTSFDDYFEQATRIALNPTHHASLKNQLAKNRQTAPLFDTARTVNALEAAYQAMWARHRAGLPPADIHVHPTTSTP